MKYINKTRFFILFVILTLIFSISLSYAKNVSHDLSASVVRLHILANSDSDADQLLKLAVRDRILKDAAYIFDNSKSSADALLIANSSINIIRNLAKSEIKKNGYSYDVSVETGNFAFPTKVYNDIMLPAGKYNAVRIKIGEGKGQNWWCVMYPPLCFTDGVVSLSDKNRQKLRKSLSESEYKLITGQNTGAIPVEVRFKLVEILQCLF